MVKKSLEILAPAGSPESLAAAVRCGAHAVYLGGKRFSARRAQAGFDERQFEEAVRTCHARGVKIYLAVNALVFDGETAPLARFLEQACAAGVDALIVQDLAVAALARAAAPSLALHASTQMSVHSIDGIRQLEELGFSRVVLARELSEEEIAHIAVRTPLELECFVHGALCMCVSGQCYLSAMIGSRSGNRGLCAQPCRLPFSNGTSTHALSLRDLSLIEHIGRLAAVGVCSLKIEGRMKRPEYVAAAVTACKDAMEGRPPDYGTLAAVFSRGGFTDGYFTGRRGASMFGIRQKEDVTAAGAPLLSGLAALYRDERQTVPVAMRLDAQAERPVVLSVRDGDGNRIAVSGEPPQPAHSAPTDPSRARAALQKTGGTPFLLKDADIRIGEELLLPVSQLNAMRRDALAQLERARGRQVRHPFEREAADKLLAAAKAAPVSGGRRPELRLRFARAEQFFPAMLDAVSLASLPVSEWRKADLSAANPDKLAVELPRVDFSGGERLRRELESLRDRGVRRALAGSLASAYLARELGFAVHGDFSLNITNSLALAEYEALGLQSATLSFELTLAAALAVRGGTRRGLLIYGYLPLMVLRNCPLFAGGSGGCRRCGRAFPELTDRKGERFFLTCSAGVAQLHNCVPLELSDRLGELAGLDFATLYFTRENREECRAVLERYRTGGAPPGRKTRGLYYRGVQ